MHAIFTSSPTGGERERASKVARERENSRSVHLRGKVWLTRFLWLNLVHKTARWSAGILSKILQGRTDRVNDWLETECKV